MLAAGQISLMSTISPPPPTGMLYLSLPERFAHTLMYINYGAFITSLPSYLDKSMVRYFFFSLCAIFILVAFLLPNIFQTKHIPKACFLSVFRLSVFSCTLFGRCPSRNLLRFVNIWRAICGNGGLEIHITPLYIVSLFF